ncbi:MAG: hypothetical protein ACI8PZ_006780 [Myxococcota bacterium]|jgi:hypothetical protein
MHTHSPASRVGADRTDDRRRPSPTDVRHPNPLGNPAPEAGLAVARATLSLREAGGGGDLARAIGLARKAACSEALVEAATEVLEGLLVLRGG